MKKEELNKLRNQLSIESKNGVDFLFAAATIWAIIAVIWQLDNDYFMKSIYVFFASGLLMPLALLFSKLLKTNWKVKDNPLQALGLLLNIAQLFYFPMLFFILMKSPVYFIMTYAVITGGHLFTYAWYYNTKWYAIFSGIISLGSVLLVLSLVHEQFYIIAIFTSISLLLLSVLLLLDSKKKQKKLSV